MKIILFFVIQEESLIFAPPTKTDSRFCHVIFGDNITRLSTCVTLEQRLPREASATLNLVSVFPSF